LTDQNVNSQIHSFDTRDQNGGSQISLAYFLTDQNVSSQIHGFDTQGKNG
jgi:hypothetical protein